MAGGIFNQAGFAEGDLVRGRTLARRAIAVVVSMAMMFVMVPVAAASTSSAGTGVENGLRYEVNADGTATITSCAGATSTSLTIPGEIGGHTVTCLGYMSLNGVNVSKLTLPSTLVCVGMTNTSAIGAVVYEQIGLVGSQLSEISFDGSNDNLAIVDNVLYTADMKTLVYYPGLGEVSNPDFVVPDGVEEIAGNAMNSAVLLHSVHFPSSFKLIYRNCFLNSLRLTSVTVDAANPYLSSDDGVLYNKDKTALIAYPCNKEGKEFVVPDNVTTFSYGAIRRQKHLERVEIGSGVTNLNSSLVECPLLKEISIDSANTSLVVKDGIVYSKDLKTLLAYPMAKETQRFEVPGDVTKIDDYALCGCKIAVVVVPSTVKKLHWSNFWSKDIGAVYVSNTSQREVLLKNINPNTNNPNRIFVSEAVTGVIEAKVDELPEAGEKVNVSTATGKVSFKVLAAPGVKAAQGLDTMAGSKRTATGRARIIYCRAAKNGTIKAKKIRLHDSINGFCDYSVTEVASRAFKDRKDVKAVVLANVVKVNFSAFQGCRNLKAVSLGASLSSLGRSAFQGCKALKSVKIASSKLRAGKVGAAAFKGTPRSLVIKAPKAKLGSYKGLMRKAGASKAKFARI